MLVTLNSVFALGVANRHSEGGNVGPNGVKQRVTFKIAKDGSLNKDAASIQVDLGDHKYTSVKPEAWINPTPDAASGIKYRPTVIITIGAMPRLIAKSDSKGRLSGDFTGKLINKGGGLKLDIKKGTLAALLSELSGKGPHALLFIKLQDDHDPPAPLSHEARDVDSRHAHSLFELMFDMDISENTKKLTAKG